MKALRKMTWLEVKLFLRDPITVLFALLLPLLVLIVMGGVFGSHSNPAFYRGAGAMNYYLPAYVALVPVTLGLISLPTQLASDRERGVLRRYRASSLQAWVVVASQVGVAILISAAAAALMVVVVVPVFDVALPVAVFTTLVGFLVVTLAFSALGMLLGSILPSARSAQALGVMLWFAFIVLGGAGPPPELLSGAMATIRDLTPLKFAIWTLQDGWLGIGAGNSWLWIGLILLVSATASIRLFRWE